MVTKNNSANLNFSLLGAAGYIAPRHLEAIKAVGGELIAAADPSDSVGILDRYFPHAQFFVSFERFEHFVNKQRETEKPIDFISICSPNYLHDTHCRFALQNAAHAICEKPLVLLPSNLERLRRSEAASSKRIFCILQLRHHPKIIDLKNRVAANPEKRFRVTSLISPPEDLGMIYLGKATVTNPEEYYLILEFISLICCYTYLGQKVLLNFYILLRPPPQEN